MVFQKYKLFFTYLISSLCKAQGIKAYITLNTVMYEHDMQLLQTILKEVKKEIGDAATIIKVDVAKNPQAAGEYQIQGVPTLILFKNGDHCGGKAG